MNGQWPPVWSSGQSSWLQIQRSGFDFRRYQIFWEVVGLERGPISHETIIEELLERKSISFGLESLEYGRWDSFRWPRETLYQQKLALTSPTNGRCLVGIVRSRTKATELLLVMVSCEGCGSKRSWPNPGSLHPSEGTEENDEPWSG
jgi:hypothetical protein